MTQLYKSYVGFGLFLLVLLLSLNNAYADNADISKKLDAAMQVLCDRQEFSGVSLVAIDDQVVFKKACGLANRDFGVKNKHDTKFNLASVGKLFTSVAIAQLVQENKISLSSPVSKLLPSWLPENKNSKTMTIEHLLIHAAGLGDFMDDKRWQLGADSGLYLTVNDYKPLVQEGKLIFPPGTSQSYSNNGYILLGAIIEKISETSYTDYFQKHIFDLAGMKNTGVWSLDEISPNRAQGYTKVCEQEKCQWKNNNYQAPFKGSPAGGSYSTVDDLFQFALNLHQGKLLSAKYAKKVLSDDVVSVSNDIKLKPYEFHHTSILENFSPYGFAGAWNQYGWAVWDNPALVGHTGGVQGASAFFATSPDGHYTIIILANITGTGPIEMYKKTRQILRLPAEIRNY